MLGVKHLRPDLDSPLKYLRLVLFTELKTLKWKTWHFILAKTFKTWVGPLKDLALDLDLKQKMWDLTWICPSKTKVDLKWMNWEPWLLHGAKNQRLDLEVALRKPETRPCVCLIDSLGEKREWGEGFPREDRSSPATWSRPKTRPPSQRTQVHGHLPETTDLLLTLQRFYLVGNTWVHLLQLICIRSWVSLNPPGW